MNRPLRTAPILVRTAKVSMAGEGRTVYWQSTNGSTKTSQVSQFFAFQVMASDGISLAESTPHPIWNFDETGLYSIHYRIEFQPGTPDVDEFNSGFAIVQDLNLDGPHGSASRSSVEKISNGRPGRLMASFLHRITEPTRLRLFISIENLESGIEVLDAVFYAVRIAPLAVV